MNPYGPLAALLIVLTAALGAAEPPRTGSGPDPEGAAAPGPDDRKLGEILQSLGEAAEQAPTAAQTAPRRQGPVFSQPGDWTHAEAAVVIGSQLVNQDLGFSRNIFQTVSAEAEDVGFGQHLGARGAFFVNRYLGAEAGFTRTTTDFEFSVTDEEAGFRPGSPSSRSHWNR